MHRFLSISILLLFWINTHCQQTNIHLFEFDIDGDSLYLESAHLLNGHNLNGYNAEVEFLSDTKILAVSKSAHSQTNTTELILMDLSSKHIEFLSTKGINQNKPSKILANQISVVEENQLGDKKLSVITLGSNKKEQVFDKLDNIENAQWLDHDKAILNLRSDLNYLAIGIKSEDKFEITEANVDSDVFVIDQSNIVYVHKLRDDVWYLKSYDTALKKKKTIIQMPNQVSSFSMLPDGRFLSAYGSEILIYDPNSAKEWRSFFNFRRFGIDDILEIKVRSNQLLVVSPNN